MIPTSQNRDVGHLALEVESRGVIPAQELNRERQHAVLIHESG
jgi:hypothetical protein